MGYANGYNGYALGHHYPYTYGYGYPYHSYYLPTVVKPAEKTVEEVPAVAEKKAVVTAPYVYHPYAYNYAPYVYNHTHTTLTVVEQFILSREKQKQKPRLIQRPGTDMPDTIHIPTVPTDILIPTEDIFTANRFSDEYRILDMAKRARVPDHLPLLIKQHNLPN